MTFYTFTVLVGWVAVVLGGIVAFAQFKRISTRGIEGVSLATWTLFLYLAVFWILYGLSVDSWQLIIGSIAVLPLQVMIWLRLKPWERPKVGVQSFMLLVVCCCAPAIFWGWAGASVGAGAAGWVTRTPQLRQLMRHKGATGVSAYSWMTGAIVSSLWVIYYCGARLWPVMSVTAVAVLLSLTIAALANWRHRQADAFSGFGHAIAD